MAAFFYAVISQNILIKTELIMERMKLNASAHQKFLILNPSTNLSTSIMSSAFITKLNSPKDRIINGKLMNFRIEPSIIETIENAPATHTALQKFLISTPLSTFEVT